MQHGLTVACVPGLAHLLLWLILSQPRHGAAQIQTGESEVEGAGGSAGHSDDRLTPTDAKSTTTYNVVMSRMHSLSLARTHYGILINCHVTAPGRFKAWVKDGLAIGNESILQISANSSNIFGDYLCTAESDVPSNPFRAAQLVITESEFMSLVILFIIHYCINYRKLTLEKILIHTVPPEDASKEIAVDPNEMYATLRCPLTSHNGMFLWYEYNDTTYQFKKIVGVIGRNLSIAKVAFRFYKCVVVPDRAAAFKIVNSPVSQMIDGRLRSVYNYVMRTVPADVAVVPISVPQGSRVTLECHKSSSSEVVVWLFRAAYATSDAKYERQTASGDLEIHDAPKSSLLSIKDVDLKDNGYYRCTVNGAMKHAFINVRVIRPTIHDYSKGNYSIGKEYKKRGDRKHQIDCEIPVEGIVKSLIWRILPPGGVPPFDIPVNVSRRGFQTYSSNSGSSQLVSIKFPGHLRLDNYRLECHLGAELDFVTLISELLPKIAITVSDTLTPAIKNITCALTDPSLTNIKLHVSNKRHGAFVELPSSSLCQSTTNCAYRVTGANEWIRCSGQLLDSGASRIYSDAVPIVKDSLKLDMFVLETQTPYGVEPYMAAMKTAGPNTELVCSFSNYRGVRIMPEDVKLMFNDLPMPNLPMQTDPETFKFTISDPVPQMSGRYYCTHNLASVPEQSVRSPEVSIRWCELHKFACDNRCLDPGVVCNGVKECADGSDEDSYMCYRFEISVNEELKFQPNIDESYVPKSRVPQSGVIAASASGLLVILALLAAASALLFRAARKRRRRGKTSGTTDQQDAISLNE